MKQIYCFLAFVFSATMIAQTTVYDINTWDLSSGYADVTVVNGITVIPGASTNTGAVDTGNHTFTDGYPGSKRLKTNGSSYNNTTDWANPNRRYFTIPVAGSATIKVWYRNGGGGARVLYISEGNEVLGSNAVTDNTDGQIFEASYTGGVATDIKISAGLNAINIYKIEVTLSDDEPVDEELTTEIIYNSCGTTLPNIASNLTLRSVQDANMYKIFVKNMTTDEEVSMEQSSTLFKLTNFSNVAYGTAFEVKAQVSTDNGTTYFAANTPCTITTPAMALAPIALIPASCGNTVLRLNQDILTPWVNDNALYCFHVSLNGDFVEEVEMPTRRFRLTNLSQGVVMGQTYEVKVRVKLYGSYSEYGSVCNVLTPSVPTTQLSAARCNSVIPGLGTVLRSAWVNNDVQAFMFAIVDGEMNVISEVERATEDVTLLQFPDFTPELGMTYNIRVKVKIGNTWGDYGSVCTVATAALETGAKQEVISRTASDLVGFDVKAYPNPFKNQIEITITNPAEVNTVQVFDITGKQVFSQKMSQGSFVLGQDFNAGVYLVQVTVGDEVKNLKIVKQ